MATQNFVFGWVEDIVAADHPTGGRIVRLDNAEEFHLPGDIVKASAFQAIFENARDAGIPLLVTIDPERETILTVDVPRPADVVTILNDADPNRTEVSLTLSQTRYFLSRSNPDFGQFHEALASSMANGTGVRVTSTDSGEVIDVRATERPFIEAGEGAVEVGPLALTPVSMADAKSLFTMVAGLSCDPRNPSGSCITFLYPDDGCYARAHEMCRLIGGAKSGKVWNYGTLVAKTKNNPVCQVEWGYHVASTISVKEAGTTSSYVIDPSMFGGPVTVAQWKAAQGDGNSRTVETDAAPYYRPEKGAAQFDLDYKSTKETLANFRLQLKQRSSSPSGPPPYAKCAALI
ncbi:hypothetical protein AGR1B_pAt30063 [Agrobacterium fabacearum S56]|uniref:protein-glutamine glutaminase family protein n=1 Tax=Agrobacterium tumefaciens TaxID=358 RepID=UPI0009BC16BF|nr:protein-glutamine glutaminase family protein [Agrobacterium tumefaciens]CUX05390.1 hypothetical protein AGR1B_pAt30063 [Agrobacterium fabacearum S56]